MNQERDPDAIDLTQLFRRLNNFNGEIRETAIHEARALPPEMLLRLAKLIGQKGRHLRRTLHITLTLSFLAYLVILGIGFSSAAMLRLLVWEHLLMSGPFLLLGIWVACDRKFDALRSLTVIIEKPNDLSFLSIALALLQQNRSDGFVRHDVGIALRRLLPQLRADHARSLTAEQKEALLIILQTPYEDVELTRCVLKTLEQVGDKNALPIVEGLASLTAAEVDYPWRSRIQRAKAVQTRQIREAAQACLPYLRAHVQEQHEAQTLLRASEASAATPLETLLRPISSPAEETPSEQLLRPM